MNPTVPTCSMPDAEFKLSGLLRALERFRSARGSSDPTESAHAIFEVLNWTHSFQDHQLDVLVATPLERGIFLGVCGARAAMHHRHFDPIERRTGALIPLSFPLAASAFPLRADETGFLEWWWRKGIPSIRQDDQRVAYQQHLEGRAVRHTLDGIREICQRHVSGRSAAGQSSAGAHG